MSRRTSAASKAVREAWEKERELVLIGKGTRDWTPEQQRSIIETGKAYDDDGRAFEGHHMKSAEAFPEYQGNNASNIQFLSRDEHQDAHGGSFRNPTNGYYNPVTKDTTDFGNSKYEPCEIIELSNPISVDYPIDANSSDEQTDEEATGSDQRQSTVEPTGKDSSSIPAEETDTDTGAASSQKEKAEHKRFGLRGIADAYRRFDEQYPGATGLIKAAGIAVGTKIVKEIAHGIITNMISSSGGADVGDSGTSASYYSTESHTEDFRDSDGYNSDDDESETESSERNYPDERSSPEEHDVSGYVRKQNGKTVHVRPYKRGGKKAEDE